MIYYMDYCTITTVRRDLEPTLCNHRTWLAEVWRRWTLQGSFWNGADVETEADVEAGLA